MANKQIQIAKTANRDVPDDKSSPFQDCHDVIHISVFFDGTGTSKRGKTEIAKLGKK